MEWLFILVLAGVAAWQGARIGALTARVRELEKRLSARAEAQWTAPTEAPLAEPAPQPAPPEPPPSPLQLDEEPLLLDQPLPPDEQEPLVLDQPIGEDELLLDAPLPEASNDDEPAPPELQPEPVTEPGRLARVLRRPANFRFGQWPVQARLAWITGSGLALGAILLVAFAAQQDWFTPQIQLACALALGAILLGAGEWTRRVSLRTPPGRAPVAALLAGAGAVAFYATIWAAHGLYNLIDYTTAAALLTVCSISLIGLSLLHGQAIGVLAIAAALVAPPLTHEPLWPSLALTLYVTAAGAAGFALAAFRRWGWVALGTLVGVYFWFWASIAVDDIQRALLLLSFASFGAVALALRTPLKDAAPSALSWQRVHALAPTIGIAVSSVFLVWVWAAIAPAEAFRVMGPAIVSASHVALAAYAVRERFATAPALVVSIAALVLGAITYLRAREYFGPLEQWHYGSLLAVALVVVICAISARSH
ncbi:MAG TPA: DUF2339 domain-containing protein, partial [Candidatus Binatia bacterium]|nr:DUF2339 domain-containing protein [Candidatus Binatia bacterium]